MFWLDNLTLKPKKKKKELFISSTLIGRFVSYSSISVILKLHFYMMNYANDESQISHYQRKKLQKHQRGQGKA